MSVKQTFSLAEQAALVSARRCLEEMVARLSVVDDQVMRLSLGVQPVQHAQASLVRLEETIKHLFRSLAAISPR